VKPMMTFDKNKNKRTRLEADLDQVTDGRKSRKLNGSLERC
jgi:hypothetical protein